MVWWSYYFCRGLSSVWVQRPFGVVAEFQESGFNLWLSGRAVAYNHTKQIRKNVDAANKELDIRIAGCDITTCQCIILSAFDLIFHSKTNSIKIALGGW